MPILSSPREISSTNMLGELRFKSNDFESETSSTLSNQSINNAYGDTSLRSIPPKLPMWTVVVDGLPNHFSSVKLES